MANALISKIKLANGTVVDLKDAEGRSDFATLLGDNTLAALKTAAWKDAQSTWDATKTDELPTTAAVKSYVDAQIEAIPTFECVVCPADAAQIPAGAVYRDGATEITGTMAASESTYKKIYLVKDTKAGAGAYNEYITIRSGAKGSYSYSWEAIGSTVIDLSGYVKKTQKIAGIALDGDITVEQLSASTALDLKALAHKASASGSTSLDTIDTINMKKVTVAGNAAVTTTSANATLTKADYTPCGEISGKTTAAGTVAVTLKDANAEASITYGAYVPAGTVAATQGGDFSALTKAEFGEVTSEATGAVQVKGSVSKPDITITASTVNVLGSVKDAAVLPTFSEGAFTAATWTGSSYTAPTWTGSSYTAPTLGSATTGSFANEGIVASVNASASEGAEDYELLVFTPAGLGDAVTAQGSFSAGNVAFGTFGAGSLAFGTFDGGSKAADTFSAGAAATFNTADALKEGTSAALDNAPAFTGNYYANAVLADTALKTVAFSGTSADIKATKVEYAKQEVSAATFSGTEAAITATFSGSTAASILTTGVAYDKADASAAFSVDVTPEVSAYNKTAKTISITVE